MEFQPLFRNPHAATIAGNFWKRPAEESSKVHSVQYRIDSDTTIVVLQQNPGCTPVGNIVILHGLEGSAGAGYIKSLSHLALQRGYAAYRVNFRTCGGTESLSSTMYHSGLSGDARFVIESIAKRTAAPIFLIGFSLGGNVALKLTGEVSNDSCLSGTIAISAPIDLAACVRAIDRPSNRVYARRFLNRLKQRIRRKSNVSPDRYSPEYLDSVHTIWQFDDRFTAPLFGFGNAANYYATQSAINFVDQIQIPTLLVAAKDDPLVPFEIYESPAIANNPKIQMVCPAHGGHIGFISKTQPRFWLDHIAMNWIQGLAKA